jgi:hypothetical protein
MSRSVPKGNKSKLGMSTLTGVIIGQDSTEFKRKNGFGFDSFYEGEIVSVLRTNGRMTIGLIDIMNDLGIILSVDAVNKKNIPPAEIPRLISKLLGHYYLLESPAPKPALFATPHVSDESSPGQGLRHSNLEVGCIKLSR